MSNGSPRECRVDGDGQPAAMRHIGTRGNGYGPGRGGAKELEAILHAAPAAMFIAHDPECKRITRSRAACELPWNTQGEDVPSSAVVKESPPRYKMFRGVEELASPESLLRQAVSGANVLGVELGAVSHDGGVTHLYGSAAPLLDKQGCPRGAIAVFVDVTELKLAYAQMAAQVQELARSNAELERLASTLAHDLRSPLMSMSGCAQLILERHMEGLSPTGRALIGNIQESACEMVQLIKCLRDYAHAGHGELRLTQCDANSALRSALHNLQADLSRAAGDVTTDTLPTVRADETLLAQLLQNLIENAIKYRGPAAPRIHVSVREEPGHWTFSVSDNGVGIDPQHFDRIFRAFERLHTSESLLPGLGIGLAICKRIAERHGGRIWVESQPGSGTTFFFSIAR